MTSRQHHEQTLPPLPESYWLASSSIPEFAPLSSDITVDAAVVGGGITGITTAWLLAKEGLKVALVDAGRLLHGTSGHTTAKITAQHDLIYDELIHHFGEEQARLYYETNRDAHHFIRDRIREQGISCGYAEEDAYVYTQSEAYIERIAKEAAAYALLGIPGEQVDRIPLGLAVHSAVVMRGQARFNPVPYLLNLLEDFVRLGGTVYEQTTAMSVEPGEPARVVTREGHKITCSDVVSCSHFPFHGGGGLYFARMHAERSYVLAVKSRQPYPGGMYLSAEEPKRSIRPVQGRDGEEWILLSGEGHRTGHGVCTMNHYEALRAFGDGLFSIEAAPYRWSAQDLVTLDKVPYIGHATADSPHAYVATGFRKWGMTTGTAAALLLRDHITGRKNPAEGLFTPSRFHAEPDVGSFLLRNADTAVQLVAGKVGLVFTKPEEVTAGEGAVVRVNGKRAGAYRDPEGQLHLVDTTCTHMGCELEWNNGDLTWDCPCHGSRFTYRGEVVEGPAKKPLTVLRE